MYTRKSSAILLICLIVALLFYGCGNNPNKLPCQKGPGYWASENGEMWFYTEGNNQNYYKATGEISTDHGPVSIHIKWDMSRNITVCDTGGNVLFTGETDINKQELEKGVCLLTVREWLVEELFSAEELTFNWKGEYLEQS
jgi:hypothetical protein